MKPEDHRSVGFSRRKAAGFGLAAVLFLLAGHPVLAADPITMKIATDVPLDHPYSKAVTNWKAEIERRTEGRVLVQIFPNAQLGGEEDTARGMKIGSVDATSCRAACSFLCQGVGALDLPFFYKDATQITAAANGPLTQNYMAKIESELAAKSMGWGVCGSRNMWNSRRDILGPADVAGLKMRVQSSDIQQATYAAFGALPTPLPFVDIFTAMQTGVIDGADLNVADMLGLQIYQVAKHLTRTQHVYIVVPFFVADRFLDKLSAGDRAIVLETGRAVPVDMADICQKAEDAGLVTLAEKGVKIEELKDRDAFATLVKDIPPSLPTASAVPSSCRR